MGLESRALLSTLTVSNTNDSGSSSLRAAVTEANADGGGDTIVFSSVFDTPQTITLTSGLLTLTGAATTTIMGPGANLLTLSGNGDSQVFEIAGGSAAAVSGLTITHGYVNFGEGGGVWNNGGNLTMADVFITNNGAYGNDNNGDLGSYGGGLASSGGTTTLTDCTLSGNNANVSGGGLYQNGGNTTLTNCTITDNHSGENGGGLIANGNYGTLTLTNCTVTNNTTGFGGGGLSNNSTPVTLTNCIVSGNQSYLGLDDISGNFTGAGNLIGGNAFLSGLGDYGGQTPTIALLPGSPAIGAGTATGAPATDQRGVLRPLGTPPDIGAFQSQGFTFTPVAGSTPQVVLPGGAFAHPLAVTVTANNPVEPVDGGVVSFDVTAASGGASATLSATTATIAGGQADVTATANATAGWYTASAKSSGAAPVDFVLANASLVVDTALDYAESAGSVTSLREAITYADSLPGPHTITFDPAVFGTTPQTITLTNGELTLTNTATTTIIGPGAGVLTISGNNATRVFDVQDGSAILSGLTVIGGDAGTGLGGGLYNDGGTLALSDVIVEGNTAQIGGGLFNNGTATLSSVQIVGNDAAGGGGLFNSGPDGAMTLTDVAVIGNTASDTGGGLCNAGGTLTLTNVTVAANTASRNGGGLREEGGTLAVTNATVSLNTATDGGGLYIVSGSTTTLTNTIVAGNSSGGDTGGSGFTGSHNLIGGNPLLAPLGDYGGPTQTMPLLAGSPAIGAGTATGAPHKDQRGVARSGHVDIGAFQSEGFTLTPDTNSSPQSTGIGQAFASPLAVTVTAINPVEPVDGGVISFTAPDTGASATLSAASATIAQGDADVTANALTIAGTYTVTASAGVGAPAAGFALTNTPGAAASVAVVSGSGQTAAVASGFTAPLVAVVEDAFGNPVPGVTVTFAAPTSGASATLTGSPAVTGADGRASVTAAANATIGSYTVTASVAGVTAGADFMLTNTGGSQNLAAQPVDAVAGQSFFNVVVATFTDPDPNAGPSDFAAAIDWGDGITTSSTTVIADGQGRFDILGTHTYVDAATYTFHVQVTDSNGAVAKAAGTATVSAKKNTEVPSLVLTTTGDVLDNVDNLTSLREAIAYANSHPGPDTITFDPSVFAKTRQTIVLTGGPLVLTDPATTTIVGPGAKRLTISGGGKSGVFDIEGGSLALSGVTIANGNADLGAGLRNERGRLVLTNVVIQGNRAIVGGGLFNDGRTTLSGVTIKGNRALLGSGSFNTIRARLHWRRPLLAHQPRTRVSIPAQERTSWVVSK